MNTLKIAIIEHDAWNGFLIQRIIDNKDRYHAKQLSLSSWKEMVSSYDAVLIQVNVSEILKFTLQGGLSMDEILSEKNTFVINRALTDITKTTLHQSLAEYGIPSLKASRKGDPEEMLFVKSNMNYGGEKDRINLEIEGQEKFIIDSSQSYFRRRRGKINERYWQNSETVIEKYVSNQEDKFCRLYACGESFILVHAYSQHIIKKINGHEDDRNIIFTWEELFSKDLELPEDLIHNIAIFHDRSGYDFYCLDLVYDDKYNFYIIDINTTPYIGLKEEFDSDLFVFLRLGLERRIWERRG